MLQNVLLSRIERESKFLAIRLDDRSCENVSSRTHRGVDQHEIFEHQRHLALATWQRDVLVSSKVAVLMFFFKFLLKMLVTECTCSCKEALFAARNLLSDL